MAGHGKRYADRAHDYCKAVLSGQIPACKWTKAACQRQLDDLQRFSVADSEYCWDADAADRVCRFVELLSHIKGEWARRREKIKLEDWQCFILCCVFGWKRRSDNTRRFRIAYTEVARKNAKSTILAAIFLYLLAADGEAGAEVYSLATTRDQAAIVFGTSKQMALREPEFRDAFGVEVCAHHLWIDSESAIGKALSADGNTLDGLNVHGAIVDELHAHDSREVWDVIETATGSRQQPLVWAITTSGSNRAGICYEQRSYVTRILNSTLHANDGLGYRIEGSGIEDDTYFGVIYTIDDEDDWTTETAWIKANPNYGVSVRPDDMQRLCRKAMQLASAQPNFLTKRLNVWVNADSAWMDMRAWERAGDPNLKPEDFIGWDCYLGLDLSSKLDMTALVALFRRGKEYRLFGRYYLPEDTISDSDNSQYAGWEATGALIATPGNVIDPEMVMKDVRDWAAKFNPSHVAYDPGYGKDLPIRLFNEGLPMVPVSGGADRISDPMREFDAAVRAGHLKHDANPAMTWMISNVVAHLDSRDRVTPRKEREENKIDGPYAAFIAMERALTTVEAPEPRVRFI